MANPEHLRLMAERMMTLAKKTSDLELARKLTVKASDYLDQAHMLEAARPSFFKPGRDVMQQAQQLQPDDPERKD